MDFSKYTHHPAVEEISSVLAKLQSKEDLSFFRIIVVYFLAKIASSMKTTIVTKDRGEMPVNVYAVALATSGYGKTSSVRYIEEHLICDFRKRFVNNTYRLLADQNLWAMAMQKAAEKNTDENDEKTKLDKIFASFGHLNFTFDSGTAPAVKQLRDMYLYANCGSMNLQVDEVGSNLDKNIEVLNVFLELYDTGTVNQKITKQAKDAERSENLEGVTPANALLFGTPSKLLDGGRTEDLFFDLLETGFARRCLFAYGKPAPNINLELTPEEVFAKLTDPENSQIVTKWSNHFTKLADPAKHNVQLEFHDDVAIELIRYKLFCEKKALTMSSNDEVIATEVSHKYSKVQKLAGIFAFIDESLFIELEHIQSAIKLVEESSEAFVHVLTRDPNYVRLANYIADSDKELTHACLNQALPFYKQSSTQRNELMGLARAYGYKNCIAIKTHKDGDIESFSAERLKETDPDKLLLSMSTHEAYGYKPNLLDLDSLQGLAETNELHFCNHEFQGEHRLDANSIPGFNLLVLDVDNDDPSIQIVDIDLVKFLLKDYTFFLYTTKRHTNDLPRFRIIMPIKYILRLNSEDYKKFMHNVFEWLPFYSDSSYNKREKKSLCNEADISFLNEGQFLDPMQFIPKTSKNEDFINSNNKLSSLSAIEKFFVQEMRNGNRNNTFAKYVLCLVDAGYTYEEIEGKVINLNKQIAEPLSESELRSTVLQTAAKRCTN